MCNFRDYDQFGLGTFSILLLADKLAYWNFRTSWLRLKACNSVVEEQYAIQYHISTHQLKSA